ncbi:MAG TPA: sialidase family protein, partial [Acidimicrobiales bacterium]|nr:sialidase family protein [Acidimicrobiales bacterium]
MAGCLTSLGLPRTVRASGRVTFDSQVTANDGRGEPEIAVDVNDPSYLVDTYTNGTAVSVDGGLHWRQVRAGQSDPVVVADGSGNFFASGLGSFASGPGSSEYQFSESTDHGTSWASVGGPLHNPLPAGWSVPDTSVNPSGGPLYMGPSAVGCDRPLSGADLNTGALFASCADHGDPAGGERGDTWPAYFVTCRSNVFAAEGMPNCGRRYVSVSHDHGKTWSAWQPEDSADYPAGYTGAFGGIPVGAHGVFATAYVAGAAPGSDCTQCAIFQTSTDDGKSWNRHLVPGATPQIQTFTTANPTSFGSTDNQSVWFEPYVAADPSRPGRFAIMVLDATRTELLVYVTTD